MQRLELPEVEALAPSHQLVPSPDETQRSEQDGPNKRSNRNYWIYFIATSLSLFWLGGILAFFYGYYGLSGFGFDFSSIFDHLWKSVTYAGWFVISASLIMPTGFLWMTAMIAARAAELRRSATELGDIALKLTTPETAAKRQVARLGHAISRELNGLNDGVDAVVARIAQLEQDVHEQSAKLEHTAMETEERTRNIRTSIAQERAALSGLIDRLETEGDAISDKFGQQSVAILEALGDKGTVIVDQINEKTRQLNESLEQASAAVLKSLDQKGAEVSRNLADQREGLVKELETSGAELTSIVDQGKALIEETFEDAGDSLEEVLDKHSEKVADALIKQTSAFSASLGEQQTTLIETARLSGEAISKSIQQKTTGLLNDLGQVGDKVDATLRSRGDQLKQLFQDQNAALVSALDEQSQSLTSGLDEIARSLSEKGNFTTHSIKQVGEDVSALLDAKKLEIGQALTQKLEALEQGLEAAEQQLTQASASLDTQTATLESAARAAVESSQYASNELAGQTAKLAAVSDKALEQAGLVNDRYDRQRTSLKTAIEELSRENVRLEEMLQEQERLFNEIGEFATSEGRRIETDLAKSATDLKSAIESVVADSTIAGDTFIARTKSIRDAGKQVTDVLTTASEAAKQTAEEAGATLDERARAIVEKIERTSQAADGALDEVRRNLEQYATNLQTNLEKSGLVARDAAKAAKKNLDTHLSEMQEQLSQSADNVDDIAEKLAVTAEQVTFAATQASEQLETAMLDLESRLSEFPDQTQESIQNIREVYEKQITAFDDVASRAARRAQAMDDALRTKLKLHYETLSNFLSGSDLSEFAQPTDEESASTDQSTPRPSEKPSAAAKANGSKKSRNMEADEETEKDESALAEQWKSRPDLVPFIRSTTRPAAPNIKRTRNISEGKDLSFKATSPAPNTSSDVPVKTNNGKTPIDARQSGEKPGQGQTHKPSSEKTKPGESADSHGLARRLADRLRRSAAIAKPAATDLAVAASGNVSQEARETPNPKTSLRSREKSPNPAFAQVLREAARGDVPSQKAAETRQGQNSSSNNLNGGPDKSQAPIKNKTRSWKWSDVLAAADSDETKTPEAATETDDTPTEKKPHDQLIENLQALCVDLTRALDEGTSVDLVRSYLKGDKELFARRLADSEKGKTIAQMTLKYDGDPDFKDYADQFITRFDELIAQCSTDKSGKSDADTYLRSNTGRVYLMLMEAAGRVF